jgi:hypothetical protein
MIRHPTISVFFKSDRENGDLVSLLSYLKSLPHLNLAVQPHLPQDLTAHDVVVAFNEDTSDDDVNLLTRFVEAGGGWLALVDTCEKALPSIFGARPEHVGPPVELRVLFDDPEHPLAVRLPAAIYVKGRYHVLTPTAADNETILYADWHYSHRTVASFRHRVAGRVACTTLQDYGHPGLQRILYRLLWRLAGRDVNQRELGVGILGYAPSVGPVHGFGAEKTAGLRLEAVCDSNPARLKAARKEFAQVKYRRHPPEQSCRFVFAGDGRRQACGLRKALGVKSTRNRRHGGHGQKTRGPFELSPKSTLGS